MLSSSAAVASSSDELHTAMSPAPTSTAPEPVGGGGAVTVTVATPCFPSLVAVIDAVPAATPVTSPEEAFTVATAASDVVQATVRPESAMPAASTLATDEFLLAQRTVRPATGAPAESSTVDRSRAWAPTASETFEGLTSRRATAVESPPFASCVTPGSEHAVSTTARPATTIVGERMELLPCCVVGGSTGVARRGARCAV